MRGAIGCARVDQRTVTAIMAWVFGDRFAKVQMSMVIIEPLKNVSFVVIQGHSVGRGSGLIEVSRHSYFMPHLGQSSAEDRAEESTLLVQGTPDAIVGIICKRMLNSKSIC